MINRGKFGMTDEKMKDVMKTKNAPAMPARSITPRKERKLALPPQRAGTADPTEKRILVKPADGMLSIVKNHDYQSVGAKEKALPSNKLWRKGTPSLKTVKNGIDKRDAYEGTKPKPEILGRIEKSRKNIPEYFANSNYKINNVKHRG